jgi:hypothetical protein
MAVTMKNAVFGDVSLYDSWRKFTANVPSSLILFTLMMEALHSSQMSVLTRASIINVKRIGEQNASLASYC